MKETTSGNRPAMEGAMPSKGEQRRATKHGRDRLDRKPTRPDLFRESPKQSARKLTRTDRERADKERKRRIKVLRGGKNKKAKALAAKIGACEAGDRCGSTACPCCQLSLSHRLAKSAEKRLKGPDPLFLLTLAPRSGFFGVRAIGNFNARQFKNTLTQQIIRADLKTAQAVGYVEMEYKPKFGKISVHFHIAIAGAKKAKVENLRRFFGDSNKKRHPMQIKIIKPRKIYEVVRYASKGTTQVKDRHRNWRAPEPMTERRILLTLDRHRPEELIFLRQFRWSKRRLKRIMTK